MKVKLSIIIPVHNEAEHLRSSITEFNANLPDELKAVLAEILLVENGSSDHTVAVCKELEEIFPQWIRGISLERPSYGEAIRRGIEECLGTHLTVLESDLLDIGFVESSVELFREAEAQFVIASKCHPRSVDKRPLQRRILTLLLKYIFRFGFGYPGSDTRGLKSIETALARRLCKMSVTTAEAFQTELVLIAWRVGIDIKELPICVGELRSSPFSVAKRLPSSLSMLRELHGSLKGLKRRVALETGAQENLAKG